MSYFTMFVLALCVSVDVLVLSVAVGLRRCSISHRTTCITIWTTCAALLLLIGWRVGGALLTHAFRQYGWIAGFILTWIGLRMLQGEVTPRKEEANSSVSAVGAFLNGFVVSLDAFGLGATTATTNTAIYNMAGVLIVVTASVSATGFALASHYRLAFGRAAEVAGGIVLILAGGCRLCF